MADPVLQLERLTKRFGALTATDDVSLDLRAGEIHALIGPNGAGKSTLIGQIAGGIAPDAGRIVMEGRDITPLSIAARARHGLGRSFQISQLAMPLSARANVAIAAQAARGRVFSFLRPVARDVAVQDAAWAALAQVGMTDRTGHPVATLSHGGRRLVELACALALSPRALLLDEPMAGMGAEGTSAMTTLLGRLKATVPILLVEHDMDAVFALADRISVLVYGRVIATGTVAEIRTNGAVREAYLGEEA